MTWNRPAAPIKLYGFKLSGHTHRVTLFLNLLDLPYELIEVDLAARAKSLPGFVPMVRSRIGLAA